MDTNGPDFENRYRQATGRVFARLRAGQGWSLREFAERVGDVAHTSLYAVEKGESTPSIDVLGRVAAAFGLDLTGIMLLIIDELDPEPASLSVLLRKFQTLSVGQQLEVTTFIDFIEYRDDT